MNTRVTAVFRTLAMLVPPAWTNVEPFTNMTGTGPMAVTNSLGTNRTTFYRLHAVQGDESTPAL